MTRSFAAVLAVSLLPGLVAHAHAGDGVKPVNLDKVNTAADETDPFIAADNTTLYYATNADKTFGIFVAKRGAGKDAWSAGKPFMVSKDFDQRGPFLYKGILYFAGNEVPDPMLAKEKNFDIFKKQGMQAPIPILGISEKTDEMHPWITPAGKEFYFSRKTEEGWVLFVARGPTPGPIGEAKPVGFPAGFHHATLSNTALEMYLEGPLEEGRTGLFHSRRAKAGAAWSKPEPVTALNHPEAKRGDGAPCLSADGARLYFASDRPGGKGGLDLWYVPTSQLKAAEK